MDEGCLTDGERVILLAKLQCWDENHGPNTMNCLRINWYLDLGT